MSRRPAQRGTTSLSAASGPVRALDAADDPGLDRLIDRAQWLDALDRRLRQSLPAPLTDHCRLGNVREDRLVFLVSSAAWSTKLRLHTADILSAACALGLPGRKLTVKIVSRQPVDPKQEPCLPLSAAARTALKAAAAGVSDPGLRDQLLRLSEV